MLDISEGILADLKKIYYLVQSMWIFSSAFALWANGELYILGPSLTPLLTYLLTPAESWKNLSILMLGL